MNTSEHMYTYATVHEVYMKIYIMFVASCVATSKDKAKYSYRYMDRT